MALGEKELCVVFTELTEGYLVKAAFTGQIIMSDSSSLRVCECVPP